MRDIRRFFAAVRRGALLLFDEAVSLFGKRSDVKDSHGRYANIDRRWRWITFTAAVACAAIISYGLYRFRRRF